MKDMMSKIIEKANTDKFTERGYLRKKQTSK